ncbi:WD40 repeat-like protein [Russula earlei]|uniref:WD40 repeat-like protein n=1 Tax=Russula earlei TaxID=71964 RepID=A0ACC0TUX4_9AGAM|nr:WD40 repeat-like protein [Russula earlei]
MVSYPHSYLFHGEHKSVAISGPHIHVLDSSSGELLRSTASPQSEKKNFVLNAGCVRCAAVDPHYTHLVTAGDDKMLKVWAIDSLQLLSEREIPKKPTQILITRSGQTIVVADKFGDVFSYPLTSSPTTTLAAVRDTESDNVASHKNPSGGTLVLGHTSLLTAFLLSPDETHIITADRDEHIRVSWFPQGHTIESFCLGHKKFISAIHIPRDPTVDGVLISGGGDPVLKVWQWRTGRRLYDVAIEEAVQPFISVRRARPKRGYDSEGERKPPSRKWVARQRRRQAKAAAGTAIPKDPETVLETEESAEVEVEADDDEDEEEEKDESGDDAVDGGATLGTPSGEPEERATPVLVVQKIETLKIEERWMVVFSAVGATALFWFALPPDPTTVSDWMFVVNAHGFGRPIVTFTPVPGSPDGVWVSLDAHWADEGPSPELPSHVRLVRLGLTSANEIFHPPSLLSTLNGACIISADEREFSGLRLYESLTSLPKNIDVRHNPMIRDAPDSEVVEAKGIRGGKAAGKMRTRMALLARGVQDERLSKKAKGEETVGGGDVMDES